MSHIFISYSKTNIDFARYLRSLLQDQGFAVWMDETRLVPSERWWPTIERNIVTCDAFIVIMSPEAKESDWVEREILVAENYAHRKPIFPVLLAGEGWARLGNIQYENMRAGMTATLRAEFVDGLKQFVGINTGQPPPPLPAPLLTPTAGTPTPAGTRPRRIDPSIVGAIIGAVAIIIAAAIALLPWLQSQFQPHSTPTTIPTTLPATAVANSVANTVTTTPTATGIPATKVPATVVAVLPTTITPTTAPSDTPSSEPTDAPTLDIVFIAQTFDAQNTAAVRTTNIAGTWTQAAANMTNTKAFIAGQTATATRWTKTPTPTRTPSPNLTASLSVYTTQRAASTATGQYLLDLSATATLWTKTPTPTLTPSITPTPTPIPTITANNQWTTPVIQQFNGVEMVEVPPGCFKMGMDNGAKKDEAPANQQCFSQPFWIDRFLVTNIQFAQLKGQAAQPSQWTVDNRPRETISWVEATAFCALRDGRLPTEAEWEYAARGPDDLIYPWGNTFQDANAVHNTNSKGQTADVGPDQRPSGKSWVGAYDMAGNVWEWTSSVYQPYPYNAKDGRESNIVDTSVRRVLRGGSWDDGSDGLRSAGRNDLTEALTDYSYGFRCARSS